MRYVKALFLILFFVVAMMFFVQNTPVLEKPIKLVLEVFGYRFTSIPFPTYVLMLLAFALGGLIILLYFFLEKIKLSGQLKACRSKVASLEQEVNSLRTMPLEGDHYSSSESGYGYASEEEEQS